MVRTFVASLLVMTIAAPLAAQPPVQPAAQPAMHPTPAALQLFQRDWVLMNWALKYFDRDGDILLEREEAEAAAATFRRIADTNHDGRVTPEEYRAARALIMAQY